MCRLVFISAIFYHGYVNANIGPWLVGIRLNIFLSRPIGGDKNTQFVSPREGVLPPKVILSMTLNCI